MFGFHFEDAEDLDFFASGFVKRGFFTDERKLDESEKDLFAAGDEGGVEDGEGVGSSGAGSPGGGEEEEEADLLLPP